MQPRDLLTDLERELAARGLSAGDEIPADLLTAYTDVLRDHGRKMIAKQVPTGGNRAERRRAARAAREANAALEATLKRLTGDVRSIAADRATVCNIFKSALEGREHE